MTQSPSSPQGLLCARLLNDPAVKGLDWQFVEDWTPAGGIAWLDLDRTDPHVQQWLRQHSGLPSWRTDALLKEDTRPTVDHQGDGAMVILRGINLNPGADPNDMVAVRLWIDGERVITLRKFMLRAIEDIRTALDEGQGPRTCGAFLAQLAANLVTRAEPVVQAMEDDVDRAEEQLVDGDTASLRGALNTLRRSTIELRRYLAPQRDVLMRLVGLEVPWLADSDRTSLRLSADRLTRLVESLDETREMAAVSHEELAAKLSERTNHIVYLLTLVAAVFLPLGLLTGLLGINVGGMPGSNSPIAFWVVSGGLVVLAAVEVALLRWLKWF